MALQHDNSRGITLGAENTDDLGLELLITHGTRKGGFDHSIKFSIERLLGMSSTFLVKPFNSSLCGLGAKRSGGAGELTRGDDGTGSRRGGRLEGRGRGEAREHEEGFLGVHGVMDTLGQSWLMAAGVGFQGAYLLRSKRVISFYRI